MKIFLTSSANMVLDKIVPLLPDKPQNLRVLFITTAGNPYVEKKWQEEDRSKLLELGFNITDFDVEGKNKDEVERTLDGNDVIFVAGGNTFYLLEKTRKSGFEKLIKSLVNSNKIYIGSSAGSCIAGPDLEPISVIDEPEKASLQNTQAFGLVDFVVIPHFGREKYAPYHNKAVERYGQKYHLVTLRDDQLVIVQGDEYQIL